MDHISSCCVCVCVCVYVCVCVCVCVCSIHIYLPILIPIKPPLPNVLYGASSNGGPQVEPQLKPLNRPPEYYFLLNKLAVDAKDKWKEIGQALDIPVGQLNSITMTDPILCYVDVFNWWQRNGSPPYTWATIIDALRAPIVGEVQLAHELEEWLTTVQAPAAAIPTSSMLLIHVF